GSGFAPAAYVQNRPIHGGFYLLGQFKRGWSVIEANRNREESLRPQEGKESRLQERRLAQTRLAKENRDILSMDAPQQVVCFRGPSVEELLKLLREGHKPRPGILRVNLGT